MHACPFFRYISTRKIRILEKSYRSCKQVCKKIGSIRSLTSVVMKKVLTKRYWVLGLSSGYLSCSSDFVGFQRFHWLEPITVNMHKLITKLNILCKCVTAKWKNNRGHNQVTKPDIRREKKNKKTAQEIIVECLLHFRIRWILIDESSRDFSLFLSPAIKDDVWLIPVWYHYCQHRNAMDVEEVGTTILAT